MKKLSESSKKPDPLRFVQIVSVGEELHGLDRDGVVWVKRDLFGGEMTRWSVVDMRRWNED